MAMKRQHTVRATLFGTENGTVKDWKELLDQAPPHATINVQKKTGDRPGERDYTVIEITWTDSTTV